MLSPSDVTSEPDFTIGGVRVSPAARTIESGDERITVEPRVMQVLILLAREIGQVVTRDTLFNEVWGNAIVGDDSLNRAVAGVRRVTQVEGSRLSLETIPRTGYRLSVSDDQLPGSTAAPARGAPMSRRVMVGGGAAVASIAGIATLVQRTRTDRKVEDIVARAQKDLDYGDPSTIPAAMLESEVAKAPDDPRLLGLLAYSKALQAGNKSLAASSLLDADKWAKQALRLDSREPNARLAMLIVNRTSIGFVEHEQYLQSVLRTAPRSINALKHYWNFLQCTGRSREALAAVERALKLNPVAASVHFPLSQLLWINGRNAEADRVIDQAIQYWPNHRFVRFARFNLLAFTNRVPAARAMIDNPRTAPQNFTPEGIALWRVSLAAMEDPTPANVSRAVAANVAAAKADLDLTTQAVMVLTQLGEIDASFDLMNALFVVPGQVPVPAGQDNSVAWRFAPWLFIPPTAPLHADPRFARLCETIGLTAYWRARHLRPDYLA